MNSFKKIAISFGLANIIILQGLQADEAKECVNYEDKKTSCVELQYFQNGDIKKEMPYKDNKLNGVVKEYYEDGQLKSETPYINDRKNGVVKEYYEDGQLKTEIPYKHNFKNGIVKEYDEKGNLKIERSYNNDSLDGIVKEYYEDGKVFSEMPYKKGERNGIAKLYHKNGNVKEEAGVSGVHYLSVVYHGDRKFYTENGKLIGTVRYNGGYVQFVKCAEKKLSKEEVESLFEVIRGKNGYEYESFKKYCPVAEDEEEKIVQDPNVSNSDSKQE